VKYRLEYLFLKAFLDFLAGRGPEGRLRWGKRLGRFWYALDGKHRSLAIDNISRGLEVDRDRAVSIARRHFEHLGINLAEFAALGRSDEQHGETAALVHHAAPSHAIALHAAAVLLFLHHPIVHVSVGIAHTPGTRHTLAHAPHAPPCPYP